MIKIMSLLSGGVLGTACRYYLSAWVQKVSNLSFPGGTLTVNTLGCLVVGVLASAITGRWSLSENQRIFLVSGFCGAFTTFSALILESSNLSMEGHGLKAFINVALNLVFGFGAFYAGLYLGSRI